MYVVAHSASRIFGGAERAITRLLGGLQRRGHRVLLICKGAEVARSATAAGVPVLVLPLGGDADLPGALRLARRLRAERPDVLIVGSFTRLLLVALAARMAGVPRVILRVAMEGYQPRSAKYRIALRHGVDGVVAVARRMAAPFASVPGYDPARVTVIANGFVLPAQLPSRETARARLGLSPEARVIGAIARLDAQKRLDRLIRVMATLPADVTCLLVGEGVEQAGLESLAARLGVRERVRFLGHRDDVPTILRALDLAVLTSDQEGMSNAMLEALGAGVPMVSTPVSGAEDALEPFADGREPGRVLRGFDEGEIGRVLAELLDDPERLSAMAAAARARALESFDFERMLDRWERVLSAVPA